MTAFRAALTHMDADPKEAARIQDLADKTDAQMARCDVRAAENVDARSAGSPVGRGRGG
jgi:hypothetical protein